MSAPPVTASDSPAPAERLGFRLRRLAMNSGVYLGGNVFAQGLAILLFPLYTRFLTPSDYGIIGVTTSVTVVITVLIGFAMAGSVARLYFEAESEEDRRSLYATALAFVIVVPGLLALGLHIAGTAGALDIFPSVPYEPYLQYAVATGYLALFMELPIVIYQSQQRPAPVMFLSILNASLIATLTIIFVVVLEQGALGLLRSLLIAAAAMALIAIGLTVRMSSRRLSRRWLVAGLAFGVPLVPHFIGHWALQLSDRLVLDQFVTTAELGLYSLGASVAAAASFLALAMARAFAPQITLSLKTPTERGQVPLLGTYWVLGFTWGTLAIALFATEGVLLLAPPQFHDSVSVIPWIVAGYLAFGLYTVVTQGTTFSMRTRMVGVLTLIAGVSNVGLNILLIPEYGIVGAAIGTLISYLLLMVMQAVLSDRLFRIPWQYGRWAAVLLSAGAGFTFATLIQPDAVLTRLAVKAVGLVVVFSVVLTVLGFWRSEEMERVRRVVRAFRVRVAARGSSGPGDPADEPCDERP